MRGDWVSSFPANHVTDENGDWFIPDNRIERLSKSLVESLFYVCHVGEEGFEHWLVWTAFGFDDRAQKFDTEEELRKEAQEIIDTGMLVDMF